MHPTNVAIASASYVGQAILMLGFALLLLHYFRLYRRPYLRFWSYAAFYYGVGAAFQLGQIASISWLPALASGGLYLSQAHLACVYVALALLSFGVFDVVRQNPPPRPWRWVTYIAALLLSFKGLSFAPDTIGIETIPLFVQESTMLLLTGIVLTAISVLIWRFTYSMLGPRLIAVAVFLQGSKNIILLLLFSRFATSHAQETLWAYQGFMNIVLLPVITLGVTIWLLESERHLALNAMQKAEFLNRHDALTKLPNRGELMNKVPVLLDSCRANGRHLLLMMIGIDRFKAVNDTLGMRGGDRVLIELSERLRKLSTQPILMGRVSGDVFVLAFDHLKRLSDIQNLAQTIQADLQKPMIVDGDEVHLSCSIGLARYPQHSRRAEGLLSKVNIALANAKLPHNSCIMVYQRGMDEHYIRLADIEPELRRAIQENEFFIQLQPIYSGTEQSLSAFEALIRWQHPIRGLLSPDEFLPYAEQLGMATEVDTWVLNHVALLLAEWKAEGEETVPIAVNLCARQFTNRALCINMRSLLHKYNLNAADIELEITENVAVSDINTGLNVLRELQSMGFHVSIDDFGTGYSSLSYLRRLPISRIKIDRSFINEMLGNETNLTIVRTLIQLSHGLKKQVIAEGVETKEQLAALQEMNCDAIQGYFMSPPVSTSAAKTILQQHRLEQHDAMKDAATSQ